MAIEKALGATTAVVGAVAAGVGLARAFTAGGVAGAASAALGGNLPVLAGALPAPNILSNYASYNYIIGLSALTIDDINYPDTSYKAGKVLPLICKSGNTDPDNRVRTKYGKWDFFIDNINFESVIGINTPRATNSTTVQFDVFEPYSIGVFMLALQNAAYDAGFKNWRDAPFLLSIEFRGNKENGQIAKVPFSTRHIPIKLTTVNIKANEQGCKYMINAYATNGQALTTQYANLKTDAAIKGTTVQQVLQTGEQSLQAIVNQNLKQMKAKGNVAVPDEIVIIFPRETDIPSSASSGAKGGEKASSATQSAAPISSSAADLTKKLGVSQSPVNKTLVQPSGQVNELGSATLGYDYKKRGDTDTASEKTTYDEKTKTWKRGALKVDPKEGTMRFSQDMDIPGVINEVLLTSSYAETALATGKLDNDGMRTWWRIDTQVYYIKTDENLKKTGSYPRIIVYRVVPYKAHSSVATAPNEPAPGYTAMKRQMVKEYNYIYTGKNSEVLKFDIDFSVNFANVMAADNYTNATGVEQGDKGATQKDKTAPIDPLPDGSDPENKQGAVGTSQNKATGTNTSNDTFGGATNETPANRAARFFHDALTNPNDMVVLNLDIYGDPYWIVNSGQGNYTAKSVDGVKDLCQDGSVNWQNGEVDILINFRSPFDINQTTGLYDFKSSNNFDITNATKASPVIGFTGLYTVNRVTNSFRNGIFRQTLKGTRRPLQESKKTPDPKKVMSTDQPVPASDKAGYATDGKGKGIY
jgi:hypothetical protein